MPSHPTIEVVPVSSALGAEIRGVDLAEQLSETTAAAIRAALGQHGVVFFRDQDLTPEQHIAFARRCGEIEVNRFFRPVEGHPMIAEVQGARPDAEHRQHLAHRSLL